MLLKMKQFNTFKDNCPVKIINLRHIKVSYINYENKNKIGELIVHNKISKNIVLVFKELYKIKFPIYSLKLMYHYNGKDRASMKANNTSSFNCRKVAGKTVWSNHAYGQAIDMNPLVNPFVQGNYVSPKVSKILKNRSLKRKGMIRKNDEVYKIFKKYGWQWGGNWKSIKDYQHFDIKI